MSFPHLYECSVCNGKVSVVTNGDKTEISRECGHDDATVWANRKVTLRGKGAMIPLHAKVTLTVRQFLSIVFGRSI